MRKQATKLLVYMLAVLLVFLPCQVVFAAEPEDASAVVEQGREDGDAGLEELPEGGAPGDSGLRDKEGPLDEPGEQEPPDGLGPEEKPGRENPEQRGKEGDELIDPTGEAEPTSAGIEPLAAQAAANAVTTFEEFKQAIADAADGDTVLIANDIDLEETIELDKSITLQAVDGVEEVVLTTSSESRHFLITGGEIHFTTRGVVLEGWHAYNSSKRTSYGGGGIRSDADHLILDTVIRQCGSDDESVEELKIDGGGAIFATGDLTIKNGELSNNYGYYGGGIYSYHSDIYIYGGILYENGGMVGGVIYGDQSNIYIYEGEFWGNGDGDGAAIYGYESNIYIHGGDYHDHNREIYGIIRGEHNSTITMTGGEIHNNAGMYNGLYGNDNTQIYMSGGKIYGNKYTVNYIFNSSFIMDGGEISDNNSSGLVAEQSSVNITGGEISNNKSNGYGGGIYAVNNTTVTITGGEITGNTSHLDGGGIWVGNYNSDTSYKYIPDLTLLEIRGDAVVKDNLSQQAYRMVDPDDIALHGRQIDPTVTWTDGFEYIYNNHDVGYTDGIPVDLESHTVTVTEHYTDNSSQDVVTPYTVAEGASFDITLDLPSGYGAYVSADDPDVDINVDFDLSVVTIHMEEVTGDVGILIEYSPSSAGEQTIRITTHYNDGALPDETVTYRAAYGSGFSAPYDMLEGYELVGFSLRSAGHFVDPVAQTVNIDFVDGDYDFLLRFDKKEYKVTITTQYVDGAYPDHTDTYYPLHGDSFLEFFTMAEGYELVGVSQLASGFVVDPVAKTVRIDSVDSDYDILLRLDKAQYIVTIIIRYPDGSGIADVVTRHPVLHGEDFFYAFEVLDGYRARSADIDRGFDVDLRGQTVAAPNVTRDMQAVILCN